MPRVSDMKQRLTDAALDLMWENSYGTTSVDAICERAGAKKGSFYYFFKSKSELTVAALEAEWNKNKANMDALFSPTIPSGRTERRVRLHPRMPSVKHRKRSEHTGPRRACYRRPHLGPEDKVF